MNVNVKKQSRLISEIGYRLFDHITYLSEDIRQEKESSTGIYILVRQVGKANRVMVSIKQPSDDSLYCAIANSVKTECFGQKTSQDSETNELMEFAGCISCYHGNEEYHVSVFGLKPEENVVVAIAIMSRMLKTSIQRVTAEITGDGGLLPAGIFNEESYLHAILNELCQLDDQIKI